VNPGQYHEVNPGQYNEVRPVWCGMVLVPMVVLGMAVNSMRQVNPGQYREEPHQAAASSSHGNYQAGGTLGHQGSALTGSQVNNVKVDFEQEDNHKTYTVEAKAGDFIIGEVGRINLSDGQTLEGVRYTALDGEVSQWRIAQVGRCTALHCTALHCT
jgi:hypothetical protein